MVPDVYTLVQLVHFSPVAVSPVSVQYFTHYKKPLLGFFWALGLYFGGMLWTCPFCRHADSPVVCTWFTCWMHLFWRFTCCMHLLPVQRRSQARSWVEWSEIGCGHLWGCLMPRNWEPYPSIWPLIPPDSWSPSPIAACKLASSPFVSHYNSAKSFEKNPRNSDQTVSEAF